jgi:hypothetical protein
MLASAEHMGLPSWKIVVVNNRDLFFLLLILQFNLIFNNSLSNKIMKDFASLMSTLFVILWENPVLVISLHNLSNSAISRISGNSLTLRRNQNFNLKQCSHFNYRNLFYCV